LQNLTKEEQIQEYLKCRSDPVYYLRNYGTIKTTSGKASFDLYLFQEDVIHCFLEYSYNIILKSRQLGISTLCAGYVSWLITFFKDKEVYTLATKGRVATNLISKIKLILNNLPDWMAPKQLVDQRQNIELANGSRAQAVATTEDAGRSESLNLLIIDEASFINNSTIENIWLAAQPTLTTGVGGDCIVLSTPNGVGTWFHQQWAKAEEGEKIKSGNAEVMFHPIKLPWQVHPERDEGWEKRERIKLGDKGFSQEHECSFLQSGSNIVDLTELEFYMNYPTEREEPDITKRPFIREPTEKTWMDKNLWIWEYPSYDKQYLVCADVARGDGGDFSAFHIIDVEKYEQVAEYKGKITTDLYSHLLFNTATQYNNAFLVVENASMGYGVLTKIIELGYNNLYWTIKDPSNINLNNFDKFYYDPYNVPTNAVPGFTTSGKTRPLIISRMEEDIRKHEFVFHSKRLYNELTVFIWKGGKAEAMGGYNDDLVMSLAIGMYVRSTTLKLNVLNEQVTQVLGNNMYHNDQSTNPNFNSIFASRNETKKKDEFNMEIKGTNIKEDFSWLL